MRACYKGLSFLSLSPSIPLLTSVGSNRRTHIYGMISSRLSSLSSGVPFAGSAESPLLLKMTYLSFSSDYLRGVHHWIVEPSVGIYSSLSNMKTTLPAPFRPESPHCQTGPDAIPIRSFAGFFSIASSVQAGGCTLNIYSSSIWGLLEQMHTNIYIFTFEVEHLLKQRRSSGVNLVESKDTMREGRRARERNRVRHSVPLRDAIITPIAL